MIEYFQSDIKRIQHALKVHAFASIIGESSGFELKQLFTLETAAILHDIGIKVSEEKYGSTSGKHQEEEGPIIAADLLQEYMIEEEILNRIYYLIGHHHTYSNIEGMDYQILIEADFLVNIHEDPSMYKNRNIIVNKYFKTNAGKDLYYTLYKE